MTDGSEDVPTQPSFGPGDLPTPDPEPESKPRNRRWFVVLAWATLVGLVLFTAWITIISLRLPTMLKEQGGGNIFYP